MFTLDPNQSYVMPPHFGPRYIGEKTSGWYHDVTVMAVSYVTDRDLLSAYIPAQYQLPEEAIITVFYACNKNIDWLAGRGYNMVGVNASVIYEGETETLTGNYSLVIWENLTDPILVGREVQGIPKVYADIPDHSVHGGVWRCNASHFGNGIVDIAVKNLTPVPLADAQAEQQANKNKSQPFTWRYLPAIGGFGQPAVNEQVTYPSEDHLSEVYLGEGEVNWQHLSWEQNPTQYHIVNALKGLPILRVLPAIVTKGSTNLSIPENWTRPLG